MQRNSGIKEKIIIIDTYIPSLADAPRQICSGTWWLELELELELLVRLLVMMP